MCPGKCFKLGGSDEPEPECYFFRTGHLQSLALLNGLNERSRLKQRVMRARIQPGHAAAKDFSGESPTLKIPSINICNLKLASCGRLQLRGNFDNLWIVKVLFHHGISGPGRFGFFLNA